MELESLLSAALKEHRSDENYDRLRKQMNLPIALLSEDIVSRVRETAEASAKSGIEYVRKRMFSFLKAH